MTARRHATVRRAVPPSRRALLRASSALVTLGAAIPAAVARSAPPAAGGIPPHPDAALLAIDREAAPLIAEYQRNLIAFFALPEGHPDLHKVADVNDAPAERLEALMETALPMRPTTLPGFAAGDAKAADLDGALIRLCQDYVTIERATRAAVAAMPLDQRRQHYAAASAAVIKGEDRDQDVLARRIGAIPARTPEGLRAKARALNWRWGGDDARPFGLLGGDPLLGSLLGDVLGRHTGAGA